MRTTPWLLLVVLALAMPVGVVEAEENDDAKALVERLGKPMREMIADGYHGKVVRLDEARQLVTLNKDVSLQCPEQVIPYPRARDIIMRNPDHIVALLDWDMTTLGDPLVDLGTLLGYWPEAGDPPERGGTNALTAQPGFPTRAQISERYARRRNVPLETIAWYEAFALWKTAAVLQQIFIRYVRGQTSDERFAEMGKRVPMLVGFAADVAGVDRD